MIKKIKVLHYIPGFNFGGIEMRTLELISNFNEEFIFDILTTTSSSQISKNTGINNLNKIISIRPFSFNIFNHIRDIWTVLSTNNYDIVHCHSAHIGFIFLILAKIYGVKVRILHSRTSSFDGSSFIFLREIMKRVSVLYSNYHLAVSKIAGDWMFKDSKYLIIPNSIEVEKYKFSDNSRTKIREKLSIRGQVLYSHIGRNTKAKNHEFLLNLFSNILKNDPNSKLILLGVNKDDSNIVNLIDELNIANDVILEGFVDNVNEYYSAFDCLLFPSLYEGFPGTLLEAQISGLKVYCSSSITDEIMLTEDIKSLSLGLGEQKWCEEILKDFRKTERADNSNLIINKGYDTKNSASNMANFYKDVLEKEK